MTKLKIIEYHDVRECETCGTDVAYGGEVYFNGELVLSARPVAACYDGRDYSTQDLLVMALKNIGIQVVDGDNQPIHVNCIHEDYDED